MIEVVPILIAICIMIGISIWFTAIVKDLYNGLAILNVLIMIVILPAMAIAYFLAGG